MNLSEWSKQFELAMEDSRSAPDVACPACGQSMIKEIGLGRLTGYACMSFGCQMIGRRVGIEQLVDAEEWRLFQEEAKIRTSSFEEMKKRNGAHDKEHDNFETVRSIFAKQHGVTNDELVKRLIDHESAIAVAWRKHLAENMDCYCTECHGYHTPTAEHPACRFCSPGFVHAPMPPEIYFNYRGWKFTPPFICMGCGIEVCFRQWAFSRSCGPCDVAESKTRRLLYGQCFVGPHEKLPDHGEDSADIPEDHFVDPKERDKYPVMRQRQRIKLRGARP